jgi:MSHA biogenesis protein MshP
MFRDKGFATSVVVAVLVMLAVLGTALFSLSTTQQSTIVRDTLGARAYQAARAGIEWGVYRTLNAASCVASTSFALPGALSDFTVTVECTSNPHTEVSTVVTMYAITATACNFSGGSCPVASPSNPNYVERQLRVSVGSN